MPMPPEAAHLSVAGLRIALRAPPLDDVVRPGEIVGLAGLEGHGQDEYLEILAGHRRPLGGTVRAGDGAEVTSRREAATHGIAYLPRDRRATGVFPTLSVIDNFAIATPARDARFGFIRAAARRARFAAYRNRLSVVAASDAVPITSLSGGNQQKILLARVLALQPRVLLLNDPTRGVDTRTRHSLYDVFAALAGEGMALIVLSTEIEEILRLCHRVMVFREGGVQARMDRRDMTVERVIAAMFGRAT